MMMGMFSGLQRPADAARANELADKLEDEEEAAAGVSIKGFKLGEKLALSEDDAEGRGLKIQDIVDPTTKKPTEFAAFENGDVYTLINLCDVMKLKVGTESVPDSIELDQALAFCQDFTFLANIKLSGTEAAFTADQTDPKEKLDFKVPVAVLSQIKDKLGSSLQALAEKPTLSDDELGQLQPVALATLNLAAPAVAVDVLNAIDEQSTMIFTNFKSIRFMINADNPEATQVIQGEDIDVEEEINLDLVEESVASGEKIDLDPATDPEELKKYENYEEIKAELKAKQKLIEQSVAAGNLIRIVNGKLMEHEKYQKAKAKIEAKKIARANFDVEQKFPKIFRLI
jgi:hypothetical protein